MSERKPRGQVEPADPDEVTSSTKTNDDRLAGLPRSNYLTSEPTLTTLVSGEIKDKQAAFTVGGPVVELPGFCASIQGMSQQAIDQVFEKFPFTKRGAFNGSPADELRKTLERIEAMPGEHIGYKTLALMGATNARQGVAVTLSLGDWMLLGSGLAFAMEIIPISEDVANLLRIKGLIGDVVNPALEGQIDPAAFIASIFGEGHRA